MKYCYIWKKVILLILILYLVFFRQDNVYYCVAVNKSCFKSYYNDMKRSFCSCFMKKAHCLYAKYTLVLLSLYSFTLNIKYCGRMSKMICYS